MPRYQFTYSSEANNNIARTIKVTASNHLDAWKELIRTHPWIFQQSDKILIDFIPKTRLESCLEEIEQAVNKFDEITEDEVVTSCQYDFIKMAKDYIGRIRGAL